MRTIADYLSETRALNGQRQQMPQRRSDLAFCKWVHVVGDARGRSATGY